MTAAVRSVSPGDLRRRLPSDGTDELGELGTALNSMLAQIEGAFSRQHHFIGDAAHEILSPLATVRTTIDAVRQDPGAERAQYLEMAEVVDRNVSRLDRLVDNLLELARADEPLGLHTVIVNEVVKLAIEQCMQQANQRDVAVSARGSDLEVVAVANEQALAVVLRNLIDNAIRYSERGGAVDISFESSGSNVVLKVVDSGTGIAAEAMPHIFEPFYRADGTRGGRGLGLSIASRLVSQMGGAVDVESTPNTGSVFSISLPSA